MPRRGRSSGRSGGGLFARRSRPAPPPRRRAVAAKPKPTAAPARQAAPTSSVAPASGGGMMSGLGGMIAQGMAFGTGSAIAHRAVGAVANSFGGDKEPETAGAESGAASHTGGAAATATAPPAPEPAMNCTRFAQDFNQCLLKHNDISFCQNLFDALKDCQHSASAASTNEYRPGV